MHNRKNFALYMVYDILILEATMRITQVSSVPEVLTETGERLRRIRINMMMTQADVASLTGISLRTVKNVESGKDVAFSTIIKVMRALRILQNLDSAVPEQTINPNDYIKLRKQRERVRKPIKEPNVWKWGDEK